MRLWLQGRNTTAHKLFSIDISNPYAPVLVGSTDFGALGGSTSGDSNQFVNGIQVQGKYAYLARGTSATVNFPDLRYLQPHRHVAYFGDKPDRRCRKR